MFQNKLEIMNESEISRNENGEKGVKKKEEEGMNVILTSGQEDNDGERQNGTINVF